MGQDEPHIVGSHEAFKTDEGKPSKRPIVNVKSSPSVNDPTERKQSVVELLRSELNEKGIQRLSDISSNNVEERSRADTINRRRNTVLDPYIPVYFAKSDKKFGSEFKPSSDAGSIMDQAKFLLRNDKEKPKNE